MEVPLVMKILAASVSLADKACSIIRTVYASKDLQIVDKGVDDLQSRADRDSQRCIVQSLNTTFPGLHVIGEEGHLDPENVPHFNELNTEVLHYQCPAQLSSLSMDDIVIWVDPLDGTKEFTEGLVEYVTVLIGISAKGKPVAGVVAQPFFKSNSTVSTNPTQYITRVVWGLVGLGVFGVNPVLPSSQLPYPINRNAVKLSLPHIIVATRSHGSPTHAIVNNAFYPTEVLRAGGCGYKVLLLLEGRGHVYVFPSHGTKKWDTCAPEAVLLASGGLLTDLIGQPYQYDINVKHENLRGILATPVADWLPAYVSCLPKEIIDDFSARD
ncbi:hypothetical protein MN116_008102 [Schistosoma mekongi]|uniref:3'(2'),5'-bisphosphate nucleotidase 1 n=1 Tax=Schistosoma mekongi TaxID=38744 RepID=A0AAE1Z7H4_SCHME|nr:hypothetical protein MN116_008102 [Schistosoma mekongi]